MKKMPSMEEARHKASVKLGDVLDCRFHYLKAKVSLITKEAVEISNCSAGIKQKAWY
jgi:hypothetical protein